MYPAVRFAGTCFQSESWRALLSGCSASRKRSGSRPPSVVPCSANCSHDSHGRRFLLSVLPFVALDAFRSTPFRYSGIAAVPRANPIRETRFDTIASFGRFGIALWASLPRLRTTWDFHRSDSSAIVRRRNHQTPRFSPMVGPAGRRMVFHRTGSHIDPTLQHTPELGVSPRPKRDSSLVDPSWPLRRRRLPFDTGCLPRFRVRDGSSRQVTDPPG